MSVNGGRQTIAYRPFACESLRDKIDLVLLRAFGIDARFANLLRSFVRTVVAVDEDDESRRRYFNSFNGLEVIR